MKCKIPEISWHNRDPVLSVDIQPMKKDNNIHRLATGGTDSHVLIWYLCLTEGGSDIEVELAADLVRHQRAVNSVKWSPNGEFLASGDDESYVIIWKQKPESEPLNILDNLSGQDKEVWLAMKVLRGHMEDVYDLSWAPNSQFVVSGSVDNSAIIWDVHKGKALSILSDHKGFVQGVAWDPRNQYIATLSTDRYLRIFDIHTKRVLHRVNKCILPMPEKSEMHNRKVRLFHDDTLQTFFRRLCFTPDGKILITPSGVTDYEGCSRPIHTTYAFSRYSLKSPAIVLPSPDQYSVAVRCCPLLFKLRPHCPERNPPVVPLPYRMIFAVATRSSVYFYDTQQRQPFGMISNIHYTRLTDLAWSCDGRIVIVSSTDGFCSLITFDADELGEEYEDSQAVMSELMNQQQVGVPNLSKKSKKQKENVSNPGGQKTPRSSLSKEKVKSTETEDNKNETVPGQTLEEDAASGAAAEQQPSSELQSCVLPLPLKALPVDIIIDKAILSSDEKFESPEKKSRPATPISVRRYPRTPNGDNHEKVENPRSESCSPLSSFKTFNSPKNGKAPTATPIAIRRTPRAVCTTSADVAKTETPDWTSTTAVEEEAMDAWPTPGLQSDDVKGKNEKADMKVLAKASSEETCERTEDIRLVYEDTLEGGGESSAGQQAPPEAAIVDQGKPLGSECDTNKSHQDEGADHTPTQKTPRRVAFRTISTPKSRKKLLDE